MSAGDPESWARLRLAQGESKASTLELSNTQGSITLTVGQSPGCDWVVRELGVAPVHFSLHWDGAVLRIADVYGAGGVRADGVLVGAQWRALSGRVRVEFGKAAIVVETPSPGYAAVPVSDSLPPMSADPRRGSARPQTKATLLGVAPIDAASLPPHMRAAATQDEAQVPSAGPRSHKPTLLGIADSVPPPSVSASAPSPSAPPGPHSSSPPSANPTLMGIGIGPIPAGRRVGGGSLSDDDQRTIQGFAIGGQPHEMRDRRVTQQGHPSDPAPPAHTPPAPALASPTGTPAASQRPAASVGNAQQGGWHETPGDQSPDDGRAARDPTPQAVLVDEGPAASPGPSERYSDAPTRMRDPGALGSKRPKRRFPWRYLGVGVLTAAAYFAWLYLLDHL